LQIAGSAEQYYGVVQRDIPTSSNDQGDERTYPTVEQRGDTTEERVGDCSAYQTAASGVAKGLLLIFSGSGSMGEHIMRIFWVFGLPPLIIMFIGLLIGIFYWILSMVRVMQALLPNLYAVKGLEFGYFTNKDEADYTATNVIVIIVAVST